MNTWLWAICLVSFGGFFGAISRFQLGSYMSRRFPSSIPYGTLTINLLGCFLLGLLMKYHSFDNWKLLIGTGFMGAFTTFSTLNLESVKQLRSGQWQAWMVYTMLSYTGGILLTFIGYYI
ncbi:fluoride efflux transporter CrcB [Paenibacillus aceris]|uniref:Fluoride-specific ion channel FluC n=1 Tax=Paenibacillus aceris TaxID=869555 RepID=A0ABS4HRN7_9BACL|nr:fluoride efflux transporter CrcB [Paenibacillus aceris]MBP1961282.1 CrcB protein [Paenibacillus aceris]NHW37930.1 fluoride efflux transporter CrcB [Paenibacillus aceris]